MSFKSHRIWALLFAGIILISGLLYYQYTKNQEQLHQEGITNINVARTHFLNILNAYANEKEGDDFVETLDSISQDQYLLKQKMGLLMNDFGESDFFDRLIITDFGGNVIYPHQQFPVKKLLAQQDSIDYGIKGGITNFKITISNTNYRAYKVPANFKGIDFNLIGLIEAKKFSKAGLNQSFPLFYGLVTLILLAIVAFPLLVLFAMSDGDMLTRSQVEWSVFSLILIATIISFTLSYWSSNDQIYQHQKSDAKELTEALATNQDKFLSRQQEGLNQAFGLKPYKDANNKPECIQGSNLDTCFTLIREPSVESNLPYHEVIAIKSDGLISKIVFSDSNKVTNCEEHSLPKIPGRHYVQNAVKDRFYLGSHYSYTKHKQEGVLSRKLGTHSMKGKGCADSSFMQAITFDMTPLKEVSYDTILDLKHLLVTHSGQVFFRSSAIKTPINHLKSSIGKAKWEAVKHLMDNTHGNEKAFSITLTLDGQSYDARFKETQLQDALHLKEPVWAVVLLDKKIDHLHNWAVTVKGLMGLALLFTIFLIIYGLYRFFTSETLQLNVQSFERSWLKPTPYKAKTYIFLSFIILLHILFFLVWLFSHDIPILSCMGQVFGLDYFKNNMWVMIALIGESAAFIFLTVYILLSGMATRIMAMQLKIQDLLLVGSLLVLIGLLAGLAEQMASLQWGNQGFQWSIFIGLQAFCLFLTGLFYWYENYYTTKSYHASYLSHYTIFTVLVIVFSGLIPGYLIHHTAYHNEKKLWDNVTQNKAKEHKDTAESQKTSNFLKMVEKGRRNCLTLYTIPDYSSAKNYSYAGIHNLREALYSEDGCDTSDRNSPNDNETGEAENQHDHPNKDHDHPNDESEEIKAVFGLSFLILLIGFYFLVKNLTKRVFLKDHLQSETGSEGLPGAYSYIIGLDPHKAVHFLHQHWKGPPPVQVDLAEPEAEKQLRKKLEQKELKSGVLIKNMEGLIEDEQLAKQVIDVIHQCQNQEIPVALTGIKTLNELKEALLEGNEAIREAWLTSWNEAFEYFGTKVVPLSYGTDLNEEDREKERHASYFMKKLYQEIPYGPNYQQLSQHIREIWDSTSGQAALHESTYNKAIANIQIFNSGYYQGIWDKLSLREKEMLYNFATERFVNYNNVETLQWLFRKGVIKEEEEEGEFVLFNDSFANFVKDAPTPEEMKAFENDKRVNGNMKNMRNALLTFIFVILAGISVLKPELVDRYVGALSGVLAVVSTLASVMDKYGFSNGFSKVRDSRLWKWVKKRKE